jgi:hypothetical protein
MDNIEWTIKNGQSRMDNPEKLTTLCTHQTKTNKIKNVNKTWSLLQTIEGKDELNIIIIQEKVWQIFLLEIQFRTGRYTYTSQMLINIVGPQSLYIV